MKPKVIFFLQAKQEMQKAKKYYEEQKTGLGRELANEINKTIERIKENPDQFPVALKTIKNDIRKALVNRFPYAIYFRIQKILFIEIISVFHTYRDPDDWQNRADGGTDTRTRPN